MDDTLVDKKNLIYGSMRTGNFINQLSGDLSYKAFIPNKLPLDVH